jgi:hypothetical protein
MMRERLFRAMPFLLVSIVRLATPWRPHNHAIVRAAHRLLLPLRGAAIVVKSANLRMAHAKSIGVLQKATKVAGVE